MTSVLADRVQALLHAEPRRSLFRCPDCGSFLDAPRIDPTTGNVARKCASCEEWHPLAGPRWEGSD
jgi:hypothetical protein